MKGVLILIGEGDISDVERLFGEKGWEVEIVRYSEPDIQEAIKRAGKDPRKILLPEILLYCVMYDPKRGAIVVSPRRAREIGINSLQVAQDNFGSRTVLTFRLDYDIKKVKPSSEKEE